MITDSKHVKLADYPPPPEALKRSNEISRLSKHSWIAGLAGAITILTMGYVSHSRDAMTRGWGIIGDPDPRLAAGFTLLIVCIIMFAIELAIRVKVDGRALISVHDDVRSRRYGRFARECLKIYLTEVALISFLFGLFRVANEYGFKNDAEYYRPWFALMPIFFWIYVYGGLPYVVLTRALQADPAADRRQAAFTVLKGLRWFFRKLGLKIKAPEPFSAGDKTAILGLCVKCFFIPLMTVFFIDQFSHLNKNIGYMSDLIAGRTQSFTLRDFYNVSFTVIFSLDVGLAWCGYVVSSRWIKNGMYSVEPTLLGWTVALLCYPPTARVFGFYFSTPSEHDFLHIESTPAVAVLAICSVTSFFIYMSATVAFGLRFSNLTHRGIITTGPYALVRHPAYAAKNLSWWFVMLPAALYDAVTTASAAPLLLVVGLIAMSSMYYLRALTEERHLALDPDYRDYAAKVPYRFIPGLL